MRIADPAGGDDTVFVKFTCPVEGERLIPKDAAGKPVIVHEEVAAIVGPQKTIRVMSPSARVRV